MKLLLTERFSALGLLPKETDYVTLKIIRDLQDVLSPSEKDYKIYEIKESVSTKGEKITQWSIEAAKNPAELKIGEKAFDIIANALRALDKKKKLTVDHFSLYEKFVIDAK